MWSISAAHNKYLNDSRFYLLFVFFLIAAISVSGQEAIPVLHQNVNLPAEDLRLGYLLHLINKQTGVKFSLNTQKFKPSKIIHLRKGIQSIDKILSEIKSSTGVYFTYLGDHVIFIDKPPANSTIAVNKEKIASSSLPSPKSPLSSISPTSHTAPESSASATSHRSPVRSASSPLSPTGLPSSPTDASSTLPHFATTPHAEKYLSDEGFDNDKIYQTMGAPTFSPLPCSFPIPPPPISFQIRTDKQRTSGSTRFFFDAGLIADENMYINPSIRVGWRFIYGIVQLSTNFSVAGFRYGVGGSLQLADKWRMGLIATTGTYSKDYLWKESPATGLPLTVKTSLQKLGLSFETAIGRRILLQFGPVFDKLDTHYYAYGVSTPPLAGATDANNPYQYIKPLYTVQDTYSQYSPQNTKLWIGLQAGVFYRINFEKSR